MNRSHLKSAHRTVHKPLLYCAAFVSAMLPASTLSAGTIRGVKVEAKANAQSAGTLKVIITTKNNGDQEIPVAITQGMTPAEKATAIALAVEAFMETAAGENDGPYNAANPTATTVHITRADGEGVPAARHKFCEQQCKEKIEVRIVKIDQVRGAGDSWRGTVALMGVPSGVKPGGGASSVTISIGIDDGSVFSSEATRTLSAGQSLGAVYASMAAELAAELTGSGITVTHDARGIHAAGLPPQTANLALPLGGYVNAICNDVAVDYVVETIEDEAIPTTSEWGLVVLTILLLTAATMLLARGGSALLAGARSFSLNTMDAGPLLSPALLGKTLAVAISVAVVWCAIAFRVQGQLAVRDVIGGAITTVVAAYLLHLWIMLRRSDHRG